MLIGAAVFFLTRVEERLKRRIIDGRRKGVEADLERLGCLLSLLPALQLRRGEHLRIVLAFTGTAYHMIGGYGHLHFKITKGQSKFTPAGELVVLPALEITVYA